LQSRVVLYTIVLDEIVGTRKIVIYSVDLWYVEIR
jgi:hypothetical protein